MAISPYIKQLRDVVGSRLLFLPSVAGLVRSDGKLLLVQVEDDGRWTTPGGALELDETPATAVVREVWEETGLYVRPTRIFAVYGGPEFVVDYPNGDRTQYISTMFDCEIISGELKPDGDEVRSVRFFSLEEARSLRKSPWLTRALDRLYDTSRTGWFEPTNWQPS